MKDDFPAAIIYATKNTYLTNTLDDCKKFLGYLPYNETSNTYFNNGAFLLAMCDEYGYDVVIEWLTCCWEAMHLDGKPISYMWEFMFKNGG
jgi:hypothetical protein